MKNLVLPSDLSKILRNNEPLFNNLLIRWQILSIAEKLVCANIVLIPVWWVLGLYRYMPTLLLLGIFCYEKRNYGQIHLKRPQITVIALLIFTTYRELGSLFYDLINSEPISITAFVRSLLFWYPIAFLLWYIQSNKIKIRLEVVAWACSVLVIQMLAFWVVGQLILGAGSYTPPRTPFSSLLGNAEGNYEPGKGLANYLIPYRPGDVSIGKFARWSFFFIIPELLALVVAFIATLALDLKNRLWSILLFGGSVFLLLLSGTRSVWLTLPIMLSLRYLIMLGTKRGWYLSFALIAVISFTTLSFPPITNFLINTAYEKSEETGKYRADSTKVRSDIYRETIERIPDNLYLGHWKPGPTVLPGFELGRVGTHSFILGTLLYHLGLVGTTLFLSFWISLFAWVFQTSKGRPWCSYSVLIMYTLLCVVMEYGELLAWMLVILSLIIRSRESKILTQNHK
ncbi:O-antigen ligase family protein [Phormidium sp. LEGE 05292]|uniref:O-antigen ligase family protein n=1 Tax=[Phormidium] sp. LEGE 05292 TaxID=767427 RepID=UPI00187EF133|nr:O-antigen ligase family protein [Phormidium sp. LEGE 05292]MBE9226057.1 O-antigen ligase family protein [Phormidium sp. LEGE 05292]